MGVWPVGGLISLHESATSLPLSRQHHGGLRPVDIGGWRPRCQIQRRQLKLYVVGACCRGELGRGLCTVAMLDFVALATQKDEDVD